MIVSLALFAQLAARCAPAVAIETLAAVARVESGFNNIAIHDNSTGRNYQPGNSADAIATATELVVVDRHSVDLGLMQINSANLAMLGLSIGDAFDACRSLTGAAKLLVASYIPPVPGENTQPALRQALSRYNTGDAEHGIANGYVTNVQAAAEQVVPAIQLQMEKSEQPRSPDSTAPVAAQTLPPVPPSWDVYGQAKVRQMNNINRRTAPVPTSADQFPVPSQQASNNAR